MSTASGILGVEAFDKSIETIYGTFGKTTKPRQGCSFKRDWEHSTKRCIICGKQIYLSEESVNVIIGVSGAIISFEGQGLGRDGRKVVAHDSFCKRMPPDSVPNMQVGLRFGLSVR